MPNRFLKRHAAIPAILCTLALGSSASAQQTYVSRFDAYVGFANLNSPHVGLSENGFQFQVGMRPRRWLSLGFDYSKTAGDLTITPDLLPDALQASLRAQLGGLAAAGRLPAGYTLVVPAHSDTQTFAAGPQVSIRKWKQITPFIRPSFGAIREVATPKAKDPIAAAIITQLAPSGKKQDWTGFYGFGGGVDLNFSRHLVLRVQGDYVRDHLFNDILKDSRNTLRFSVGPAFNFGRNVE